MNIELESFPHSRWTPLPHPDCRGVDGRVLVRREDMVIAMLRFARDGTIHDHAADHDIDVLCIEGEGRMKVGDDVVEFRDGQQVRWPAGVTHQLWTEGSTMKTLMMEHLGRSPTALT